MTTAVGAHDSQATALLTLGNGNQPAPEISQVVGLVVYAPPSTKYARVEQIAALLPLTPGADVMGRVEQVVALVAYATGTPDQSRSRAWAFTLDGHNFYTLNLGLEGTFLLDTTTQQWCKFSTQGYDQWNMLNGCMWGNRIVAGDSINPIVWELDPNAVLDDGWRDIIHTVTGGLSQRSRMSVSCASVRVSASFGALDTVNGATMSLSYSDDWGNTWSDPFTVSLLDDDYGGEIAWRSLGSFASPGRIFRLTDVGGVIRIDGADAFLDGFDNDTNTTDDSGG